MTSDAWPGRARRRTLLGATAAVLARPAVLIAQPAARPVRIAWLSFTRADNPLRALAALRAGLREHGWVEGAQLQIDAYWGDDSRELLEQRAAEVLQSRPDLIVAHGYAVFPLLRSGTTVPVVFGFSGDPVEAGFVQSLARPGRNMTGTSMLSLELVGKRMELLKAALPGLKRVAVIANTTHAGEQGEWRASQQAASALGLTIEYVPVRDVADVDAALGTVARSRSEALMVFPDAGMMRLAERFATFAGEHRVATASGWAEFVRRGNLLSYGPNLAAVFRRLGYFVDRILKGAKPGDLPVEWPTVVELAVNLRAARTLSLSIPQALLLRADEVIE